MRAVFPEAAVATETIVAVPPLVPMPGSPAESAGAPPDRRQHDDDGLLRQRGRALSAAGIPAIICGPGSIDVAHQPNEFITRDELAAGQGFLDRLLAWAEDGAAREDDLRQAALAGRRGGRLRRGDFADFDGAGRGAEIEADAIMLPVAAVGDRVGQA